MDSPNNRCNGSDHDKQIYVVHQGNALTGVGSIGLFICFLLVVLSFCLGHHIGYHFGVLEERQLFSESYQAGEIIYTEDFKERMYGSKKRSYFRNKEE